MGFDAAAQRRRLAVSSDYSNPSGMRDGGLGRWLGRCRRRRSRPPALIAPMPALLHRLFPFLLVIAEQGMDFTVRFLADSVDLRTELLARSVRILIHQRLNLVVVLHQQRPDLLLLLRS